MLFVLFAGDVLRQVVENAVHPHTGKAALPGIFKYLFVLALLAPDHGRQDDKPGALSQRLHPVHDLIDGLAADLLSAPGAVGRAHPRPEETEVVVDFRHGAYGGAGIFGGGFLIDGNGRGKAVDGIHVRLVHLAQKLPGIGA